jgi:hypothetical protein
LEEIVIDRDRIHLHRIFDPLEFVHAHTCGTDLTRQSQPD